MMDENASSQDQDFSKLSIEDRINHKNWKARLSGYEELNRLFPQFEDKEFQRYAPLIKKFPIDSNAAAQEKALSAVLQFVDYCPNAGKYVDNIIAGVATKCLTSTRAKTKELANDVVLMCVEIEKQDIVIEELIKALDQKTPKNVAATISMLRKCLNQFGYKVINVKPIVPNLARLLEERDPSVRDEAKQLTIEIHRWIKDALVPQLSSLKPILLQELQVEFDKNKDLKAQPERLLRSQQQRQQQDNDENDGECNGVAGDGDQPNEEQDAEMDPFELMEPVDILSKLPTDFYTLIEAKKWTERRDGLDKLHSLLTANPKLATNSDYAELVKQLKKIIGKDSNIVVATLAIKCMSLMANGLRKNFHNHANSSVPILLEKFKEKKANVVEALRESIDAVYISTTMEAISEDLVQALDNKNPSIRSETALFLARSFAKTNPNLINKKLLKTLTNSLIKTLSDSDAVVRESSAAALGTALKAQGERNMSPFLQGLEALKMTKIEEFCAQAQVKKFPNSAPAASSSKSSSNNNASVKPKTAPPVKKTNTASKPKPPMNHLSNESLNDDFQQQQPPASASNLRAKPKIGGSKSRLGGVSSGGGATSDGASSISSTGSSKPRIGGGGGLASGKNSGSASRLVKGGLGSRSNSNLTASSGLGSTNSGSSSAKKQDLESGPLMNGNLKLKEQRFADEKALKVLKWNFTTPREEFYLLLREQMTNAEWSPQLITYCFHSDFKFHIKAIDLIRDFFQKSSTEDNPVVLANLDLVLKWIALRFFDTNPSVITKALELLLVVFRICEQSHQYTLNDIEANSFIPYLVLKVGDPKDAVRNKVHEIFIRLRNIYPANKIITHLFTGLQSKNARQRATCLEEISQLIELRGMSIFQPPNSLQLIKDLAKFIAERDNGVRNGALSCIVQVYFLEGERVFKLIGSLSDKEMSLVEERIKRASKNRPTVPVSSQQQQSQPTSIQSTQSQPTTTIGGHPTTPRQQHSNSASCLPIHNHQQQQLQEAGIIPSAISSPQLQSHFSAASRLPESGIRSRLSLQQQQRLSPLLNNNTNANVNKFGLSTPTTTTTTASDDTESEEIQSNYKHNGSFDSNNGGHTSSIQTNSSTGLKMMMDTQDEELSSDYYSTTTTTEDDALNLKVKQALNQPEPKFIRRYRSHILSNRLNNNANNNSATIQSSSNGDGSDSDINGTPNSNSNRLNQNNSRLATNSLSPSPQINQKFQTLFNQLSSTELSTSLEAIERLNQALKDYEKYRQYLEPKIDQLIILCNKQFRLFLTKHYPEACEFISDDEQEKEQKLHQAKLLFRQTSAVLCKIFKSPLGKKVSRDTLRELITHLLNYFVELRQQQTIFNSVNVLIEIVLNESDATNLFSALIRILHDYVGTDTVQYSDKFLEITMKFIWRVTKILTKYMNELNVDQIIYESHLFFKSYPKNYWKMNNRDDLPLRTIKTLIYYFVEIKGDSILNHFTLIENKDESELWLYVQKALRQCEKSSSTSASASSSSSNLKNNSNVSVVSSSGTTGDGLKTTTTPSSIKTIINNNNDNNSTNNNFINGNGQQSSTPTNKQNRFPLKMRQININNETGEIAQIPILQNEQDLKTYFEYTTKKLNIPELNYDDVIANGSSIPKIRSVEDARRAVDQAQKRLDQFKLFLQNN